MCFLFRFMNFIWYFFAVRTIDVQAVEGNRISLPCPLVPPSRDKVYMVLWFRDDAGIPLYRLVHCLNVYLYIWLKKKLEKFPFHFLFFFSRLFSLPHSMELIKIFSFLSSPKMKHLNSRIELQSANCERKKVCTLRAHCALLRRTAHFHSFWYNANAKRCNAIASTKLQLLWFLILIRTTASIVLSPPPHLIAKIFLKLRMLLNRRTFNIYMFTLFCFVLFFAFCASVKRSCDLQVQQNESKIVL